MFNGLLNANSELTRFMRKGEVGNWKVHLTPDMITKFEAWEKKWLKDTDYKPVFEL